MKHTPGPWYVSTNGPYIRTTDRPDWPDWNVAEVNLDHDRGPANARLIAAAPEMYDVINRLLGNWGDDDVLLNYSPAEVSRAIDDMRALFARINGGAG